MKTGRLSLLALPLALLAACVGPYGTWEGDDGYYDEYDDGAPMVARLYGDGGYRALSVSVNRPAYVAIFEIIPGQGVGLLYPARNHERAYLRAGTNRLSWTAPRYYDWYYSGQHSGWNGYNRGYGGVYDGPRYLFLIASRRPLHISRFQHSPGALRSVLGYHSYTALNSQRVMSDLVDAVVPAQPDEDWATDFYTVWPSRPGRRLAYNDLVTVNCGGRGYVQVPVELVGYACRSVQQGRDNPPPVRDSTGNGGRDSLDVPTRRRPVPTEAGGTAATPGGRQLRPEGEGSAEPEARRERPRGRRPVQEDTREQSDDRTPPARVERPAAREEGSRAEPRGDGGRRDEGKRESPPARSEPRSSPPPSRSEPARSEPRSSPPPSRSEPARSEPRSSPPPSRSEPAKTESSRSEPRVERPTPTRP